MGRVFGHLDGRKGPADYRIKIDRIGRSLSGEAQVGEAITFDCRDPRLWEKCILLAEQFHLSQIGDIRQEALTIGGNRARRC